MMITQLNTHTPHPTPTEIFSLNAFGAHFKIFREFFSEIGGGTLPPCPRAGDTGKCAAIGKPVFFVLFEWLWALNESYRRFLLHKLH